jgi:hypothetical protein
MTVTEAAEKVEAAGKRLDEAVAAEGKQRGVWRAKIAKKAGTVGARTARATLARRKRAVGRAENALAKARGQLQKAQASVPKPPSGALWHPRAARAPHIDSGSFAGGGRKIVWHTTEGSSLPNYGGSAPHFTLNPQTGQLWQHIPLNRAARALAHPSGPETNRANAIQVELIGFAKDTGNWSAGAYANIAELARWIEAAFGVPRRTGVQFTVPATRLSGNSFFGYAGHIGHAHVPGNDHWDPGKFRIDLVV